MSQTKCSNLLCLAMALLIGMAQTHAAISVGGGGSGVLTFDTLPATSEWSTLSVAGGGADIHTTAQVDTAVQLRAATDITAALGSSGTVPPSANAVARWNSAQFYLQSRPTGNNYTILMATLRNDLGSDASDFTITFDLNMFNAAALELPGFRVYYSYTGTANSWSLIPELSDINAPGTLTVKVTPPVQWPATSPMYLLFADDNADTATDESYTIDNFSVTATPGILSCVGITNETSSVTVPERGGASFSIMATGSPQLIQWYRNNTAIPGANTATYSIPSVAYPGDNGATFRAIVTNSLCSATSTVKTLTVIPDTTAPVATRVVGDVDPTKVHLTFSEPLDAATVNESAFEVFVTGTNPDGSYITFGVSLTNGTNVTITTDPRVSGETYSVQILDVRDASSGNNVINPNPAQVPIIATVQLIGFDTDNEWKYDINNGDRTGTGWEQPGFDDSTWPSGPAGLGLDASVNGVPIRTTIAYAGNGVVTYYRKHFNFPGKTNGVVLTLRDVVEDGAVYYLNGQEILRNRMPAGAITFATLASGATDPTPIAGPFSLAITNLQPGDNVLAVAVHQSAATSTDVQLAVELTATIQEYLSGAPKITGEPQSQTVAEGANVNFTATVEGALPLLYTWKKNGVAISGATNASFSISGVVPNDAGNYSLSVTNASGGTNSTTATLAVTADTTPPVIVSAVGDTNLNVVVVTLRDPAPGRGVNLASASNPAHYTIQLRSGGGALAVTSVVATNIGTNTIVTLTTTAPRVAGSDYSVVLNNVVDNSVAQNPVTPNTAPVVATIVLFTMDSTWRYDQSGADLGTAWKDLGYDDSPWPTGRGVFGFETTSNSLVFLRSIAGPDGTNTVLSLSNGITRVITYYFRTTVNVPFDPASATMQIRSYVDDGMIIYVNGIEQLRFNQTNGPGYTNLANAALTEPTPAATAMYLVTNLNGFISGNNLIAVEVHQDSAASSDADFGLQLEALVNSFIGPVTGPRLHITRNPVTGQVTISWTGSGTLQEANSLTTSGPNGWSNVAGNPNPYTFTPVPGQNRFFSLKP